MCGIFGTTSELSEAQVQQIKLLLNHRGPDSWGHKLLSSGSDKITLLHTRLAIQDLTKSGHQPMASKDGNWWITFNGEIYNHFDLRKRIGADFNGTSDTETLVEYIAAYGIEETVAVLNGIFAFAAFNLTTGQLHLVRDPFGIKPLYYQQDERGMTFSSEIKPLNALSGSQRLNNSALDVFLSLRYVPSPQTLLQGVSRLPPGHYLTYNIHSREQSVSRYIRPTSHTFRGTFDDAVMGYHSRLKEAVRLQLISDVPVGVLLSGGIDSAVIAALAREYNPGITGFTVGFGDEYPDCEIEDAAQTAEALNIRHESITVTPQDLQLSLEQIFSSVEEPLGTTSIMPMWSLTQLAKSRATVVLTGQGNDEPWGGYRRYQIELLLEQMPWLKNKAFHMPEWIAGIPSNDGLQRGLRCLGETDTAERFLNAYALFTSREITEMTGRHQISTCKADIEYWLAWLESAGNLSDSDKMMRIDARMNLADDLLLYGDKVSMAFALEARVPMLDPDLVEFIESLPLAYRTSLRETKIAHRAMAREYLPAEIINRPKKGFQVPFGKWSRGIWKDYVADRLVAPGLKLHDHIERHAIEKLWKQHRRNLPDKSRQVFALMMLSGWCEEFLD